MGLPHKDTKMKKTVAYLATLCLLSSPLGAQAAEAGQSMAAQLLVKGRTLAKAGKLGDAAATLQAAVSQAEQSGDKFVAALALHNLAELHRLQGSPGPALHHYRQATGLYQTLGNGSGLALTQKRIDEIVSATPGGEEAPESERSRLIQRAVESIRSRLAAGLEERKKADYLRAVKDTILKLWRPPAVAAQAAAEGEVEVTFTILPDGRVESMRVSRSSGEAAVDEEALRSVKAAAPFAPPPSTRPWALQVSFRYGVEKRRAEPA
jgi:TonB family protein